jgi:hypothetical protein
MAIGFSMILMPMSFSFAELVEDRQNCQFLMDAIVDRSVGAVRHGARAGRFGGGLVRENRRDCKIFPLQTDKMAVWDRNGTGPIRPGCRGAPAGAEAAGRRGGAAPGGILNNGCAGRNKECFRPPVGPKWHYFHSGRPSPTQAMALPYPGEKAGNTLNRAEPG